MVKVARVVCALLLAALCCQSLAQRAPAVPEKCCFNFQMRRIKRDNIVACYPTSPECPHQAVMESPVLSWKAWLGGISHRGAGIRG
uniref:Chemokine interleukin-8-like domain-containing protein n=1 Tax=Falco tinnunculus TaxID=100819 RepID=A0A8C4UZ89_FALTI